MHRSGIDSSCEARTGAAQQAFEGDRGLFRICGIQDIEQRARIWGRRVANGL